MKKWLSMILALTMTLCLVACGSSSKSPAGTNNPSSSGTEASAPAADPIVIKLTTTNGSSNAEVIAIQEHCDIIRERTNGMVDIQVYPDGQMMVYAEGIQAVMSNSNVIYYTACNLFSDYVPEFTTVYMPYLFENTKIAEEFFKSDVWNQISAKADAAGVHVIANNCFNGYRSIYANKPINSAADCKGLTLRIPDSTLYIETFKALGVNYMPMSSGEVYSGMQTGMLDGAEGVPQTPVNQSIWEMPHQMYYSLTQHIQDNGGYFIGYDFWMSIPEEYRAIMEEELYAAFTESNAINDTRHAENIAKLEENGVIIVDPSDKASFQAAVADLVKSQPMGQEVLDQIAAIKAAQ